MKCGKVMAAALVCWVEKNVFLGAPQILVMRQLEGYGSGNHTGS